MKLFPPPLLLAHGRGPTLLDLGLPGLLLSDTLGEELSVLVLRVQLVNM
jgi:hypothetical protein